MTVRDIDDAATGIVRVPRDVAEEFAEGVDIDLTVRTD